MNWIRLPDLNVEISTTPVTRQTYFDFAQAQGLPLPAMGKQSEYVTGVSASQASAFAQWFSRVSGRQCRLPELKEIKALAQKAKNGLKVWTCWLGQRAGRWRGGQDCLSEWLECTPDWDRQHLHCITDPAWLSSNGASPS